jgi:hypothetical protein
MINGTGTVITDPTTDDTYPDNNNNNNINNPMKTPAKTPAKTGTQSTESANAEEDNDKPTFDYPETLIKMRNNNDVLLDSLLNETPVQHFFHLGTGSANDKRMQAQIKFDVTSSRLQAVQLPPEIIQHLQKLFVSPTPVTQNDVLDNVNYTSLRPDVQVEYTTQVIRCLEMLLHIPLYDKSYMIDKIVVQYKEHASSMKTDDLIEYFGQPAINKNNEVQSINAYKSALEKKSLILLIDIYNNIYNKHRMQKNQKAPAVPAIPVNDNNEIDGSGLRSNKYYIDRKAFGRGILAVRYRKNKHLLQDMKPVQMSNDLRRKIESRINVGGSGKNVDIDNIKLNPEEQRVYNQLLKKYGHEVDDTEQKELDNKFNNLIGEISAGNDNKLLKQELRSMLIYSMKTGAITRSQALDYFLEFSL